MKRRTTAALADNSYFDLVRRFPLKPIGNDRELEAATAVMHTLVDRGQNDLTKDEAAYLDVLSDIIEKYEQQHHPIPDASPVDVLKFLIEDRHTNQRTVALDCEIAVSTMSELLAGRRQMNLEHMRKLARYFKVDVAVFLPEAKATPPTKALARKR